MRFAAGFIAVFLIAASGAFLALSRAARHSDLRSPAAKLTLPSRRPQRSLLPPSLPLVSRSERGELQLRAGRRFAGARPFRRDLPDQRARHTGRHPGQADQGPDLRLDDLSPGRRCERH
ncbi:MAG: hypothetical protein M0C28_44885 [Candidatus Moduliflexus flocculans]|nr:hypothetical protein [Candidatus Moduliflexus flocculans]